MTTSTFYIMAAEKESMGIKVKKADDMPSWYGEVCIKAELADYAPTKGCMIIRPRGYAIWQNIQDIFNKRLKELNVENAYFPLFIPESFFKKEKEHAEGFNPEVAWVEQRDPKEERIAVRPTSETIMYDSYSRWIRSYRDLPLRINQWCNIVRWETEATKLFLRSREFLWQEGHCVYETEEECDKEARDMLEEYRKLVEDNLALPLLLGRKTEKEKFAGAKTTYTIEAFMPDGKALQCGTSHNLGQTFSNAFNISFTDKNEKKQKPWQNSWGVSTRLIGGMVMTHSDDKGLIIPPKIASVKAVIVPIFFEKTKAKVLSEAKKIQKMIDDSILDDREEYSAGWRFSDWELKGVPVRIELGPKDLEKDQVIVARRDNGEKIPVKISKLKEELPKILDDIQNNLFNKAKKFLKSSIIEVKTVQEMKKAADDGKLSLAPFCGGTGCEEWINEKTAGVTPRVIPFNDKLKKGSKCIHCEKEAEYNVYFSRAY
ncbi:proline--tRNA ligase [Nanoarchaeota archaeon]